LVARPLSASPKAPPIECHHWISVCASAPVLNNPALANAATIVLIFMGNLVG
jgi:hypothetical protein